VQSTNETPQGPLTLRVYAGDDCSGSLYLDDGKTYAYQQGNFLRMHFTCEMKGRDLEIRLSPHHGTYGAWWKDIRVEVYGWKQGINRLTAAGKALSVTSAPFSHGFSFTIPDDGQGMDLTLQ
jgi:alpha-glucosidase